MPKEHTDALNRKNIIEKRKEEAERREQDKTRDEARCVILGCLLFFVEIFTISSVFPLGIVLTTFSCRNSMYGHRLSTLSARALQEKNCGDVTRRCSLCGRFYQPSFVEAGISLTTLRIETYMYTRTQTQTLSYLPDKTTTNITNANTLSRLTHEHTALSTHAIVATGFGKKRTRSARPRRRRGWPGRPSFARRRRCSG